MNSEGHYSPRDTHFAWLPPYCFRYRLKCAVLPVAFKMEKTRRIRTVKQYENSRSSGVTCAVRQCHNNQRRLNDILCAECFEHKPLTRQECPCGRPFNLHYANSEDVRRQWNAQLQLKKPPAKMYVCSFHFVDREPTKLNPDPTLYVGYSRVVKTRRILSRCMENSSNDHAPTFTSGRKRKPAQCNSAWPGHEKQQRLDEGNLLTVYNSPPPPHN